MAHYYLQKHAGERQWYRAEVLKVIDGDSFKARTKIWLDHLVETNIRVRGIDTPETRRAKCKSEKSRGKAAKKKLAALLAKGVILHNVEYDKYGGRVVADVYTADFKNISLLMIDTQHAKFYDGRGPRPKLVLNPADSAPPILKNGGGRRLAAIAARLQKAH